MPRKVALAVSYASTLSRMLNTAVGVLASVQQYPRGVKVRVPAMQEARTAAFLTEKGFHFRSKRIESSGPVQSVNSTITEFIVTSRLR